MPAVPSASASSAPASSARSISRTSPRFPDLKVVFIADIDLERAEAQAEQFGVPRSGTVEQLLADPEVEIVVNLTIPAAHVEVADQALDAGKHVWNEKPFSLDRRERAGAAREGTRSRGSGSRRAPDTFLGAGLQTGKRLIAEGRIGTPLTAVTMVQGPGPESWHPNPDFFYIAGGGPLFDMGPYYLTDARAESGTGREGRRHAFHRPHHAHDRVGSARRRDRAGRDARPTSARCSSSRAAPPRSACSASSRASAGQGSSSSPAPTARSYSPIRICSPANSRSGPMPRRSPRWWTRRA